VTTSQQSPAADWSSTTPAELLAVHLRRPTNTARAYRGDLIALGEFLGMRIDKGDEKQLAAIVERLVNMPRGAARRTVDEFIQAQRIAGKSLATMRRRAAATLSLLGLAHRYDVIAWSIKVKLPVAVPVKDTAGPGREVVAAMLSICKSRYDAKGARDLAIMSLLYFQALRAGEVLSLRLADIDLNAGAVVIEAKGRVDRVRIATADDTTEALAGWIEHRGPWPGPLFVGMSPSTRRRDAVAPLTYSGLYAIVRDLGIRAGARRVHPHAIRHAAATELLKLTNGNIPYAMALTRHSDPKTLIIYNDAQRSIGRRAAEILAAGRPCFSLPS